MTIADAIGVFHDFDGEVFDPEEWTGVRYDRAPEPPEIVCLLRPGRGYILVGSAIWHGTDGGYQNHRCRCLRCRAAHAEQARRDRARRSARSAPRLER